MHLRENQHLAAGQNVVRHYLEHGTAPASSADEITKLAALKEQGLLTDSEFAGEKARVLSLASVG